MALPTSITVQSAFNGVTQAAVTYSMTGYTQGAVLEVTQQAATAVSATGRYGWSATVTMNYPTPSSPASLGVASVSRSGLHETPQHDGHSAEHVPPFTHSALTEVPHSGTPGRPRRPPTSASPRPRPQPPAPAPPAPQPGARARCQSPPAGPSTTGSRPCRGARISVPTGPEEAQAQRYNRA
jgi:hypothetical protein